MKKTLALSIGLIAIVGVIMTAIGASIDSPETPFISAVNILKYFTIQSNIMVALYFFLYLIPRFGNSEKFNKLYGAVVVYITITGVVFLVLLSGIWHPTGLTHAGTILNHYIVPPLAIVFLVLFRKDYSFNYKNMLYWLIYPNAYMVFLLIHGFITRDFIYPFADIYEIGILYVLISYFMIHVLFFVSAYGTILLTKGNSTQAISDELA